MAWNDSSWLSRIPVPDVKKLTDEEKKKLAGEEAPAEPSAEEQRAKDVESIRTMLALDNKKPSEEEEIAAAVAPVNESVPEEAPVAKKGPAIEDLRSAEPSDGPVSKALKTTKKREILNKIEAADKHVKDTPTAELVTAIPTQIANAKADPATPPAVAKDLNWLEKQYAMLNAKEDAAKESLEWRQAIETIAQSMTQLFAAQAGLKSGIDMSGLKFDKTDFNKKIDQLSAAMDKRRAQAETLLGEEKAAQDKEAKAAAEAEKLAMDKEKLALETKGQEERIGLDKKKLTIDQEAQDLRERMATDDKLAKQQELGMKEQAAQLAVQKGADPELVVPGHGVARSKEEAKDFRKEIVDSKSAIDLLEGVIKLGTDVGPLDFERKKLIEQNLNMAIGKLRLSMVGPGAMTESERELIKDSIGDPRKFLSTEEIEKSKLKNMVQKIQQTIKDRAKEVIAEPIETPKQKLERLRALRQGQ